MLYQQAEITALEAQLDAMDKEDSGSWRLSNSISLNDGYDNTERKELVEKIVQKLNIYG